MLIGDWDRHYEMALGWIQKKGQVIYRPIPRDREAFSKFDGALLSILMTIPTLRHMQTLRMTLKYKMVQ
jgi:hypothetical protein